MGRRRDGPLIVRVEGGGSLAASLAERAAEFGVRLATEGEPADLVARIPPVESAEGEAAAGYSLSGRELEILEYLVDGWSNAEISSVLGIAVRTVRFHLEGLYSKLGVTRRGEASREALARGLVRFDA
jgi:LuxR family transcriptional regulator, maltose regulon positive regulatory protein